MSKKNPYLLSAAQIRRWAATHNEEAWVLLLRILEGQNEFFMRKRGEETARTIQNVEAHLAKGGMSEKRAKQLRKVLAEITRAAGNLEKEHKNLAQKLSGLSGSGQQLEAKLERLRTLQAKQLALDSKLVKDMQQAKETARTRELEAKRKADLVIAKAVAKSVE